MLGHLGAISLKNLTNRKKVRKLEKELIRPHVMLLPYDLLGIYGRKKLAQQDNNKKQNRVSFMAHMKLK